MIKIKDIEKVADKSFDNLDIWGQPAHLILSTLYNIIYELFFSEGDDSLGHRFKAERIMSYLSGAASKIASCDGAIIKITEDISNAFSEQMGLDIQRIVEYGQLCTIMDRVHKGEFVESCSEDRAFLHFKNEESFLEEAQDVLISELTLPHFSQPKHVFDLNYAFRLGSGEMHFDPMKVANQVRLQRAELEKRVNDIEYVDDFSSVVSGLSDGEYRSLKLSALALSLYIRTVSRLLKEAISKGVLSGSRVNSNLLFWRAPCFKRRDIVAVLTHAASVKPGAAEAFFDNFSMNIGSDCPPWIKSGYFPPFQNIGARTIFSPAVLLVMMTNRNAIYICSKRDEQTFHNVVSERMEPKLVADFLSQLPHDGSWVFEKSVKFPAGEIDLVCFNPERNIALQIQAKGSIAPEGAVLVRNFEARCEEGVNQLRRFDALSQEDKVELLKRKLPTVNFDTVIVPCLLARGSFGRPEFLQKNRDIIFINPFLASKVFLDPKFDWVKPIESTRSFMSRLSDQVGCSRSRERFSIFDDEFYVEMPVWNRKKLNEMKVAASTL